MPYVFISYSADARKWAAKLSDRLQTEGLSTWSDFQSLVPGQRRSEQLEQALDNAKFYVFVVGPRNVVREWQDFEWQAVLKRTWSDPGKRVIPVLIGHADAPPFLKNWVSLRINPDSDESGLAKKITDIVRGAPEKPARVRTSPDKGWRKRIREIGSAAKQLKAERQYMYKCDQQASGGNTLAKDRSDSTHRLRSS